MDTNHIPLNYIKRKITQFALSQHTHTHTHLNMTPCSQLKMLLRGQKFVLHMTCSVWTVLPTGVCWAPASLTGVCRQQVPFPGTRGSRTSGFLFPVSSSPPPGRQSLGSVGGASSRHQGQLRPHSVDCNQKRRMIQPQMRKDHTPYFEKQTAHIIMHH